MSRIPLSPLDAVFVQSDSELTPMHVAALMQFELPEAADDAFVADLVARFRSHQQFSKPWNLVLEKPRTLQLRPCMQTAQHIDMEYHVRHLALPRPGGERELGQLIARLHSQRMDLRKPLWECHVIEGLADRRFAIYMKLHHALIDGVSGSRMLMRALVTDPKQLGQLPFWATGSGPDKSQPSAAPKARKRLPRPAELIEAARASARLWVEAGDAFNTTLRAAPMTPFNGRVGPQRRFATHAEPITRLKRIAKAADASLNDIVLAMTGSALRAYLLEMNALPELGLTASIPVSMREADDTSTGNAVSMIFANTGTHIADERARVEAIKASTAMGKARLRALSPAAQKLFPVFLLAPVAGAMISGLAGRTPPAFNVTVSNVPGGNEQRYLYGARLTNIYPVSIAMHGAGLNITCYSHAGILNFGFTACRDSVPHVQRLAVYFGRAVERLEEVFCSGNAAASFEAPQHSVA